MVTVGAGVMMIARSTRSGTAPMLLQTPQSQNLISLRINRIDLPSERGIR